MLRDMSRSKVSVGNINLDASSDVQVDVKTMPTVNATGYVTVKNFPATQTVSGSVSLVGTSPVDADIQPLSSIKTGQITVGATTSKALTSSCTSKCVSVEPHSANTGKVYVGGDSSVTTSTGWELVAPISFDVDNASKIYVIANQANQKVCWAVLG